MLLQPHFSNHFTAQDANAENKQKDDDEGEREAKRIKTAGKGKVNQKKCQFKPYDEDEKKQFSTMLQVGTDTRTATALDDVIQALNFVISKMMKAKVIEEADIDSDRVTSTYGFCVGLFLEFAWNAKVTVNGKDIRQYSALRGELQQTLVSMNEQISFQALHEAGGPDGGAGSGSGSASGKKSMNPLELAELLCQNFLNKPVTSVVWDADDPDEQVIKNIADAMSLKQLDEPIKKFVSEKMHLPILMHVAVQDSLQQVFSVPQTTTQKLVDVLSICYTSICADLPASWCGFAFDVSTAFADRGHFVENTDQAGITGDEMEKRFGWFR